MEHIPHDLSSGSQTICAMNYPVNYEKSRYQFSEIEADRKYDVNKIEGSI